MLDRRLGRARLASAPSSQNQEVPGLQARDLDANLPWGPAGSAAVPGLPVARPPHGTDDAP